MARGLLAEGRAGDVVRMLDPLVEPLPENPAEVGRSQLMVRALLARARLLRYGDPERAYALLRPFEPALLAGAVEEDAVRAEAMLWLGWVHAWHHTDTFDDARALHLLEEAERLFTTVLNTSGRCWALLGKAQAYFTIDEYPLMLRALSEAEALQERAGDSQASLWLHVLGSLTTRFEGCYGRASEHIEALKREARALDDPFALGQAHAYEAALLYELGRAPEAVIEAATEAETLLTRAATAPGYALLTAFRAHIGAVMRCGDWEMADHLVDRALDLTEVQPTAAGHLLLLRARLEMLRGRYDRTQVLLAEVSQHMRRLQHRLLASSVALLRSELLERLEQFEQARRWADRAYQNACETGHGGQQLAALFRAAHVCLAERDPAGAAAFLERSHALNHYLNLLPFAAGHFHVAGTLALQAEQPEEAYVCLTRALSATSLTGDLYQAAVVRLNIARLCRATDTVEARSLAQEALECFERLPAPPEAEACRTLLASLPEDERPASTALRPDVATVLARSALSLELVAATWLEVVRPHLPDRWLAVCRLEGDRWSTLHMLGTPPEPVPFPPRSAVAFEADGVYWLRLHESPGMQIAFAAGIRHDRDSSWDRAYEFLKPWIPVAALAFDHALLRARRLEDAATAPLSANGRALLERDVVHASPAMRELVQQIRGIRASHSPVLITGERGTGKEMIARAVHEASRRRDAPLVVFNCASVTDELLESHLFGHQKGTCTDPACFEPGRIREADGGTLFLNEVDALPMDMQRKLLEFLESGEVFPSGARHPVPVNVRIVAATHRDLRQLIREGRFHEELFFRLSIIRLRVPPLRERREDIPLLIRHFADVLRPAGMPLPSFTNRALEALLRYDWPGNVRQLRNEIERVLVFLRHEPAPTIDLKDLSPVIVEEEVSSAPDSLSSEAKEQILLPDCDLDDVLASTEKALIERVLSVCEGQVAASAKILGLTRQGLYKKIKRLGIDTTRYQKDGDAAQRPAVRLN